MNIGLTPDGLQRYEDVLTIVFSGIRRFQQTGIPHYLFDENQVMAELSFRYKEPDDSSSRVTGMSAVMQHLPLEELPQAAYLYKEYDPALYQGLLNKLTPDNALVTLVAKGVPADQVETHYGAHFGYAERTGEPYDRLAAAVPNPQVHLPLPNPYIPRVSGLLRPQGPLALTYRSLLHLRRDGLSVNVLSRVGNFQDAGFTSLGAFVTQMDSKLGRSIADAELPVLLERASALPTKLIDDESGRVFYLADWQFRQPRAHMILRFRTGNTYGGARQAMLAQVYAALSYSCEHPEEIMGARDDIPISLRPNRCGHTFYSGFYKQPELRPPLRQLRLAAWPLENCVRWKRRNAEKPGMSWKKKVTLNGEISRTAKKSDGNWRRWTDL